MIGAPVRPGEYATRAKRSAPFCANRRQISSPSSSRKLAAHLPAAWMRGQVVDDLAAQNNTSCGSSETDVNELQAIPTGSDPSNAVTRTTPLGKCPRTVRKVEASGASGRGASELMLRPKAGLRGGRRGAAASRRARP